MLRFFPLGQPLGMLTIVLVCVSHSHSGRITYVNNNEAVLKGTKAALVKVTKERNTFEALFKEACALAKELEVENAKLRGKVGVAQAEAKPTGDALKSIFKRAEREGLPNSGAYDPRRIVKL
jgi:hypothetical protein